MDLRGKYRIYSNIIRNRFDELTHSVGLRRSSIHISEYPKSGGTWVTEIVQDIGKEAGASGRLGSSKVIHQHWQHRDIYRPAIYVVRDGRDVVVSFYFHHIRVLKLNLVQSSRIHKYFTEVLGVGYDVDDIQANLPRFIENLRSRPHGGTLRRTSDRRFLSWPDHIRDWLGRSEVLVVRYEQLLTDTVPEVRRIAQHLGVQLGSDEAQRIAAENSFEAKAGRKPGEEDRQSFYRKGVAGDWRNHFTSEAASQFVSYAGDILIELGYESDHSWADGERFSEPPR